MKFNAFQAGVTLVELLVVITIAAILTATGVPSYRYVTTSNRIAGEVNGLLGDLQFARYEAIKEGLAVTACPASGATSNTCAAGSSSWHPSGWIVLSNAAALPVGNAVLRRQRPFTSLSSNDTLASSSNGNPATSVSFNREGFLTGSAGPVMFSLHDPTGNSGFTRCLIISVAGAMNTTTSGKILYGATCT